MRPPEEVKRELVQQWIATAEQDLGAAETLLSAERPFFYPVCFHAQQAGEKYLKAFLTWHQVEFPKTHSLGELLDMVGQVDSALESSLQDAIALNPYGVDIRYPGDAPEPDRGEAQEAVELARKVMGAVQNALKGYA